jgi:hypothetical protein
MNHCKICDSPVKVIFHASVLKKYNVEYSQCTECGFLQSETPFWLEEAYQYPINKSDTGLVLRNMEYSKVAAVLLYYFFDEKGIFLDYAGGYGLFTRVMRDYGFDYYWQDPYAINMHAAGFEFKDTLKPVELITSFESFEHFVDPVSECTKMLDLSTNFLFSTELLPLPSPQPGEWWYYGFEHGQHISFYTEKSLIKLANIFDMNYYRCGALHLFTRKNINRRKLYILLRFNSFFLRYGVIKHLQRKTENDSELIKHEE